MKRILIIEDEPDMLANLADALEMEGFKPLAAPNGRDGIALAKEQPPDLILCDILMPGLDGYAVLAAIRADPKTARIPFIFLTAKGERGDIRSGMDLGADDYLVKPVPLDELLGAIRARLERRRQHAPEFKPEFKSPRPLESLGLSPRQAEILFWLAQGKSNSEIGAILAISPATAKKHLEHVYQKIGAENRSTAMLQAIETLAAAS
jgi:DNA-binding NarL/FixJ family response regulator